MAHPTRLSTRLLLGVTFSMFVFGGHDVFAAGDSLKDVQIPLPKRLGRVVKDMTAARMLGKALFWEEAAGGDGQQACASCHWSAGADTRAFNTVNPHGDGTFDIVGGPDQLASASSFPIDNDDVVGSGGVVTQDFTGLSGTPVDNGSVVANGTFGTARQVTGRNTPTAINAIFNELQFHDGRASKVFNGVDPSGRANSAARVFVSRGDGSSVKPVKLRLRPASLASQAVGPPGSDVEMSWNGRSFPELGRKLMGLQPLSQQEVAVDDSLLGMLADTSAEGGSVGVGLNVSYDQLIEAAFHDKFWNSSADIGGFTQKEMNFSMFWGISILLYEATLVSDETPFDNDTMNASQQLGFDVFEDSCKSCHRAPEFTEAAITNGGSDEFLDIGVRPLSEDAGRPGEGFKVPTLRNVELTGPYMHNGGFATLRQVVDFYDRGGNFPNDEIEPMGMSESEKVALVDFLVGLTDERVRTSAAPFDHPQLHVPNGPTLPATGMNGGGPLLTPFLGLSPQQP